MFELSIDLDFGVTTIRHFWDPEAESWRPNPPEKKFECFDAALAASYDVWMPAGYERAEIEICECD